MRRLTPIINTDKPVLEFYEDGDWLRIEAQGQPTRYIQKKIAVQILLDIGNNSFTEKSNLIII